ncbi:hypothetical protein ACFV1W_25890 [Kitasatospora sp. NPDC059648]|uniref:hypothetical protein n=1 Tax=Kitasatospora sp. NPDC059648 TaxID=3346894 RepID=UPI00369BFA6A
MPGFHADDRLACRLVLLDPAGLREHLEDLDDELAEHAGPDADPGVRRYDAPPAWLTPLADLAFTGEAGKTAEHQVGRPMDSGGRPPRPGLGRRGRRG